MLLGRLQVPCTWMHSASFMSLRHCLAAACCLPLQVVESHQARKVDVSGTAREVVDALRAAGVSGSEVSACKLARHAGWDDNLLWLALLLAVCCTVMVCLLMVIMNAVW